MMKIFSGKSYMPPKEKHVVMLYPFWGKNPEDPGDPTSGRFDRYTELGRSIFREAELDEANVAVLPGPWERIAHDRQAKDLALELCDQAEQAGKSVVIFFVNDSDEHIPVDNAVVFRTSMYRSTRNPNEFAMPVWSEDFVGRHLGGELQVRAKSSKPVIGFCGAADPLSGPLLFLKRTKRLGRRAASRLRIKKTKEEIGNVVRGRALRTLSRSALVNTNFVIRRRFLGGASLPDGRVDLDRMQKIRLEYVQNMANSDYVLCARGGGNFSYRLYETLNCGRVPVFIDTDCVLPYESEIDWKSYCVWVDESEIPFIAEKVAEFHDNLSQQDFLDLQRRCRSLWEQWLSPEGFFTNFYRHFAAGVA